ncbi:hypothetical protein A3L04_06585 [Thermococcus chitonophagus]|uniref:Uncharacterized protein n=1 Tax=Thermococcus chitonophagus TaxID=54262 RepID=A0A170SNP6_9EURY|nr:DUF257 family protein [Thermococcus chitonophagus]ASJ16763.1 hypothetical protein A3L04_06585 [Thermococcus chitonophagus]CUX78234.1 hypothetical protein CHITON_1455 [Thermococcus chitonophagus]
MDILEGLLDGVKYGEVVLIKYPPSYVPEFTILQIVEYAKSKGVPVIIDDNFDAFPIIVSHLEALGVSFDTNTVYVVKTGGSINVGNVIAKIRYHPDPRVYLKEYRETMDKVFSKFKECITISVGVESVLSRLTTPQELYLAIFEIQKALGNKNRKSVYLINERIFNALPSIARVELSRIASTIVNTKPYTTGAHLYIVKSPNPELVGKEITVDVGGKQ